MQHLLLKSKTVVLASSLMLEELKYLGINCQNRQAHGLAFEKPGLREEDRNEGKEKTSTFCFLHS